VADYPEVAESIKGLFKSYLEDYPSQEERKSNALDDMMKGAIGFEPLLIAKWFAVLHLGYVTREDRNRSVTSAKVWKNLEGGFSYHAGVLDCDLQMMSAKNVIGQPTLTPSSYKIVLQIFGSTLKEPGSFKCDLNDWSIPQNPSSTIHGSYAVNGEGRSKYKLIPHPIPAAQERYFHRRKPRGRSS